MNISAAQKSGGRGKAVERERVFAAACHEHFVHVEPCLFLALHAGVNVCWQNNQEKNVLRNGFCVNEKTFGCEYVKMELRLQ